MACLTGMLAAEDAHAIYDRINQIAHTDTRHTDIRTDDAGSAGSRTIDARRADVLTALLLGNRREHVSVELQVIAPIGTLAGLDNNPAELAGYGPIPAHVGRALAADAHWRRILTDPATGTVLDLGHRRVPPPHSPASSATNKPAVCSPAAACPPPTRILTTPSPTPKAAAPPWTTSDCSANATITPNTAQTAGTSTNPNPASSPGPAHR
jgi:hypothetical protein